MRKKDPTLFETDRIPFDIPRDRMVGVGPGTYFVEKHVTKDYGRQIKKDQQKFKEDTRRLLATGGYQDTQQNYIAPNTYQKIKLTFDPGRDKLQPEISRLQRHNYKTTSWYKQVVNDETRLQPGAQYYHIKRDYENAGKIDKQIMPSPRGIFPISFLERSLEQKKIMKDYIPDAGYYQDNMKVNAQGRPITINVAQRVLSDYKSDSPGPGSYKVEGCTRLSQGSRRIQQSFSRSQSSRFQLHSKGKSRLWRLQQQDTNKKLFEYKPVVPTWLRPDLQEMADKYESDKIQTEHAKIAAFETEFLSIKDNLTQQSNNN